MQESQLIKSCGKMLNTSEHGALPQNRPRVYVVGIRRDSMCAPFTWPGKVKMAAINEVLDPVPEPVPDVEAQIRNMTNLSITKQKNMLRAVMKLVERSGAAWQEADVIVDIGGGFPVHTMTCELCPCLTAARAGDEAFWSFRRGRVLSIAEMMRLQGVNPGYFQGWEDLVSPRSMGIMLGSAMTQSIVERVMRSIFISIGVPVKADRWA